MLELGELISFHDAAATLPVRRRGRPAHVGTLHRWRAKGIRGVRLPAKRVGGVWMTSCAALSWFVDQLTALGRPTSNPTTAPPCNIAESGTDRLGADGW